MQADIRKHVRHNFLVNVLDGGFFGMAIGFASFVTIIPLFVNKFTDSSLLIGLIASIHLVGWQLPQILTANHVAQLRRFKPMVIFMTIHERWPFLGMAFVALFAAQLGNTLVLILTFILMTLQALFGGFTATAWQSMIAKVMPPNRRGTFYGAQSSAANLLSSLGALIAGAILLASGGSNEGFALTFLLSGVLMFVSFAFIAMNREPASEPAIEKPLSGVEFRRRLIGILRRDGNYRTFILARMLIQAASIGSAFYTVFAVRQFNMDEGTAGIMTGVFLLAATIGNPLCGWLGDRYSRRIIFAIGGLLAGASALAALAAPDVSWFYLVFALLGLSNGASWTSANAMTADFGGEKERPFYISLVNTLIAPVTLLAPIIGGFLADSINTEATLWFIVVTGALTAGVAFFLLREPQPVTRAEPAKPEQSAVPVTGC
jgi:MFS family permease